jgi:hypothetical protein
MLMRMAWLTLLLSIAATPALGQSQRLNPAQRQEQGRGAASAVPAVARPASAAKPTRILFVGNSFTQGAHSSLRNWHGGTVTDLNGAGYGGVPALFRQFAQEAGLAFDVSLETQGGKTLGFHYDERRALLDQPWDVVVLQELSTLDRDRPGDATNYIRDVQRLTALLRARNPAVRVYLMATWTRADETYRPKGHWFGRPVTAMADDLRAAADRARAATPGVSAILPVGQAWSRAFTAGVADPNPYDGTSFGQVDLWSYDQYHASVAGYYLEALVAFGRITGVDPLSLGRDEPAADELGLAPATAAALQSVAHDQLAAESARSAP